MAFGMRTTTGDFLPIVKYDSRAGKMFKVDKRVDGGSDTIELPPGTKFALDFGTLEAGYVSFSPQGPIRHMKPYVPGEAALAQPLDKDAEGKIIFRPGFYIKIAGNAVDGVREWCSNAQSLTEALGELHDIYLTAPQAMEGKIPVVSIPSTKPVKTGSGAKSSTNYAPNFNIDAWVDRPDVLGARVTPIPGRSPGSAMSGAAPGQNAHPGTQPIQQPAQPAQPAQATATPAAGMPF